MGSPFSRRASLSSASCLRARRCSCGARSCRTTTAFCVSRISTFTVARSWCFGSGWATPGTPATPLSASASSTLDLGHCGLFDTLPFVLAFAFFGHHHLCVDGAEQRIIHTQVSCWIIPRSLVFFLY